MPQVINTNVASLNAQRNLNRSQESLTTSLQRISSGLRINSAKDDAAGLAISDRLTSQIRGMNQAVRNASDAISLAQTGEGALQEITNNLQRMRELAVQSRNATNTAADRASLDAEFQQLLAENDRIAETTAFNGRAILDGSLGSSEFQVGANVGETISVDVNSSMRNDAIGLYADASYQVPNITTAIQGTAAATLEDSLSVDDNEIVINGTNVTGVADDSAGRGNGSALSIVNAINADSDTHGVTATAGATSVTVSASDIANFGFNDDATTDDTLVYELSINDQIVSTQTEGAVTVNDAAGLAQAINGQQSNTGVTAQANADGSLTLTANDGRNIEINEVLTGGSEAADEVDGYFGNTLTGSGAVGTEQALTVHKAEITLTSSAEFTVATDDVANEVIFQGIADGASATTAASGIGQANVLTTAASDGAINRIDQAINDVDSLRGTFGAVQARFSSTIASLQTASENQSAARSRIQDADFAQETAALTRSQILQQAGVSILAQANALPQNVLALLQ